MTKRFTVSAVFLAGLGAGCALAPLLIPRASAQQAASLTKWEMLCLDIANRNGEEIAAAGTKAGAQGWEPVGANNCTWCWKRPKL